jgi:hypothetical protein
VLVIFKRKEVTIMDENNKDSIPTTEKINTSSPGTLAIERFKLALTIDDSEGREAQKLKDQLLDK